MRTIARRNKMSSEQTGVLTDTSAVLSINMTRLEKANSDLKVANNLLEHKVRSLQVAVAILLAVCGGISTGLATTMIGAAAQTAFSSATTVFFALIMASVAILSFMHR